VELVAVVDGNRVQGNGFCPAVFAAGLGPTEVVVIFASLDASALQAAGDSYRTRYSLACWYRNRVVILMKVEKTQKFGFLDFTDPHYDCVFGIAADLN